MLIIEILQQIFWNIYDLILNVKWTSLETLNRSNRLTDWLTDKVGQPLVERWFHLKQCVDNNNDDNDDDLIHLIKLCDSFQMVYRLKMLWKMYLSEWLTNCRICESSYSQNMKQILLLFYHLYFSLCLITENFNQEFLQLILLKHEYKTLFFRIIQLPVLLLLSIIKDWLMEEFGRV